METVFAGFGFTLSEVLSSWSVLGSGPASSEVMYPCLLVGRQSWCFQEQQWGHIGLSFEISPGCKSSWLFGVYLSGLRDWDAKSPRGVGVAVGGPPGGLNSSEQHLSCALQAPCGSGMNVSLCGTLASRALEGATWHCTPHRSGTGLPLQQQEQCGFSALPSEESVSELQGCLVPSAACPHSSRQQRSQGQCVHDGSTHRCPTPKLCQASLGWEQQTLFLYFEAIF